MENHEQHLYCTVLYIYYTVQYSTQSHLSSSWRESECTVINKSSNPKSRHFRHHFDDHHVSYFYAHVASSLQLYVGHVHYSRYMNETTLHGLLHGRVVKIFATARCIGMKSCWCNVIVV